MVQNNDPRMPYLFSQEQIDTIATAIGSARENGLHGFDGINSEIGASKAREAISDVQRMVASIIGSPGQVTLMLSDDECKQLSTLDLPFDIKEIVSYGVQ